MKSALLYATTVLTGGLVWFATKFQLGRVPPEISLIYRFSVAALLLAAFALVLREPIKFGAAIHLRLALFGALVFSGNFALLYAAIENLTSGLVAIIFSTSVLMNIAFGVVFLGRKIESGVVIGALLGVCGLGLIFHPDLVELSSSNVRTLAILQALGATMLFSLGNMVSAGLQKEKIPALVSTAFAMGYGALLLFVYAVVRGRPFLFEMSQGYILSLIYLTIFGSFAGYGTYFALLGRIGPERTAYTTVLVPALALGVSTVFEGFTWRAEALVGASLIFGGNVAIVRKQKPPSPSARQGC
jgi:drug/metabolite transporter (DMT)-like permease